MGTHETYLYDNFELITDADPEVVALCAEGDPDPELCARVTGGPVLIVPAPPTDALAPHADAFVFEGADVLLRLDYIAKLVELARLGGAPDEEFEESLREALDTMRDYIAREEGSA